MVEASASAVTDAHASAASNGASLETLVGDVEEALEQLGGRRARFAGVVLDPPRRGCTTRVRSRIAALRPRRIAYVSCDPETLARDLDHFKRLGYGTLRVVPIDMIPLTDEVEVVALLERAPPPHPPVAHEDDALLVVDRWADEPTVATVERVRGRAAWSRAEVVWAPGGVASGVCAFARDADERRRWTAASERASATVVAMVRGITHERGTLRREAGPAARYQRLRVIAGHSLVEVALEGATSARARRELAAIDHPVLGDERLGHAASNRHAAERYALGRAFVHVTALEIDDPRTRGRLRFETPLAADLALVIARMDARDRQSSAAG
jgi:23S rRNA (uracil1939-C5)-methyltransferase